MVGARSGAVAIRVSAKGGIPRVYRLSTLVEVPDMIRGRLPPVGRVVGLDAEAEFLYVVTGKGEVLAVDLGSARADTVATAVEQATLGPDGTLFTVDAKRRVVSLARRLRVAWAQPLPSLPHQLFGAADQRLVAVDPPKLLTAAADQPAASRPIPTGGDVAATRWGDLLAVDRKSTRLNSSHLVISYAVFCLKKKKYSIPRVASYVTDT